MRNPSEPNRSLVQILQDLRDFRATQPPHDLSVLRHRSYPTPVDSEDEQPENEPVRRTKKSKRNVESEE